MSEKAIASDAFIKALPKVELHVHLEGSIRPATLLELAHRHNEPLPADTVEGLEEWYTFTDFPHFAEIYQTLSRCVQTVDDIELIARDFLQGQADQNIRHSEVTYTAHTIWKNTDIPFEKQLAALNKAREWGEKELGVSAGFIIDIPRDWADEKDARMIGDWVVAHHGDGVIALGLAGYEVGFPPEDYTAPFDHAAKNDVPAVVHAGETMGADSIWGAMDRLQSVRIGHGVRCLEDRKLVDTLRTRQVPLEVCPTSNVCLGVADSIESHPLPDLIKEGLYVTINTDDPPMFGTTLNDELIKTTHAFGFSEDDLRHLMLQAARASLLPKADRQALEDSIAA